MSIYPNLTKRMNHVGVSVKDLSGCLNTSNDIVLMKLSGQVEWTWSDIVRICALLNCSDISLFQKDELLNCN